MLAAALGAAPADAAWYSLATPHFTIFYASGHEPEAWQALQSLEWARPAAEQLTGNARERVPVVIEDIGTESNGLTDPVNVNMHLFTYPPGASLLPEEHWWTGLTVHEYTHLLHLTWRGGGPGFIALIGGNEFNPSGWVPAWLAEGFAVYDESSYSRYSGRLNDGFFDAYLGASVAAGRFPTLLRATFVPLQYPLDIYYLAGGEFYGWLARTRGPEKLAALHHDYGSSFGAYLSPLFPGLGLDAAAERTYGTSIRLLWNEWTRTSAGTYAGWHQSGERLTRHGWDVGGLIMDQERLLFTRTYPVKTGAYAGFMFAEIWSLDPGTGAETLIVGTTASFSAPMVVCDGSLYYAVNEVARGYGNVTSGGFGLISLLHARTLATGEDRIVVRAPLRAFAVLPDHRILYTVDRTDAFGSRLLVHDPAGGEDRVLATLDLLVDELAADELRIVATARRDWAQFSLYQLDPAAGTLTPVVDTPWIESRPVLAGGRMLFVANWNRRYAVYEWDFATGRAAQLTTGGYAAWPAMNAAGNILYFAGLTADGFDVFRTPVRPLDVPLPADPPTVAPDQTLDRTKVRRGGLGPDAASLVPRALHLPYVSLDGKTAGAILSGGDAIGFIPAYDLEPMWDLARHRPALTAAVAAMPWPPLMLSGSYTSLDDRAWSVAGAYPLVVRLSPGISSLQAGASVGTSNGLARRVGEPFVETGCAWPLTAADSLVRVPLERRSAGSAVDRTGVIGDAAVAQYLPDSELLVQIRGIADRGNPDTDFARLRGYRDGLGSRRGGEAALDLTRPVLMVRDGFWRVSMYLEDIALGVFANGAAGEGARTQYAYGAEAIAELRITNLGAGLALGARVVETREHVVSEEAIIEAYTFGSPGLRPRPGDDRLSYGMSYRLRRMRSAPAESPR